jgi:hypothetical protein
MFLLYPHLLRHVSRNRCSRQGAAMIIVIVFTYNYSAHSPSEPLSDRLHQVLPL